MAQRFYYGGQAVLEGVMMRGKKTVVTAVRHHHESWDGTGYPDKLSGGAIPRLSRIIQVADAYDAMTTDRPYRSRMPESEAVAEIRDRSGIEFDPEVVAAFLRSHERGAMGSPPASRPGPGS